MLEYMEKLKERYESSFTFSYKFLKEKGAVINQPDNLKQWEVKKIIKSSKNIKRILNEELYEVERYNLMDLELNYDSIDTVIEQIKGLLKEDKQVFIFDKVNVTVKRAYTDTYRESLSWLPNTKEIKKHTMQKKEVVIAPKRERVEVISEEQKERQEEIRLIIFFRDKQMNPVWNEDQMALLQTLKQQ